jgi:hypothetical protein
MSGGFFYGETSHRFTFFGLLLANNRGQTTNSGNPECPVIASRRSRRGNPEYVVIARRRSRRGNPGGLNEMHFCLAGLLHFVRNDGILNPRTSFAMTAF